MKPKFTYISIKIPRKINPALFLIRIEKEFKAKDIHQESVSIINGYVCFLVYVNTIQKQFVETIVKRFSETNLRVIK